MARSRRPAALPPETRTIERWKLTRDIALSIVGVFMLVYETLQASPQPLILGAALVLLGLPATLRLDEFFRR